jgi:hypothetical protein
MTTSICECYKCSYKFNYEWIPGASLHSIRLGTKRIFRCPNCKILQKFDLRKKGPNKSLKTYGDSSELGIGSKIWAILLVPTLIPIFFGAFSFFIFIKPVYIHFVLIAFGIVWISMSLLYVILTVGPKGAK